MADRTRGWLKRLGWLDQLGQSVWFWGALVMTGSGTALVLLGRATDVFMEWAPFSYGLVGVVAFAVAVQAAPKIVATIPKRTPKHLVLGRKALRLANAIMISLENERLVGLDPRPYYRATTFLVRLAKEGYPSPALAENDTARPTLETMAHYLSIVGNLLEQGDVEEAEAAAEALSRND